MEFLEMTSLLLAEKPGYLWGITRSEEIQAPEGYKLPGLSSKPGSYQTKTAMYLDKSFLEKEFLILNTPLPLKMR